VLARGASSVECAAGGGAGGGAAAAQRPESASCRATVRQIATAQQYVDDTVGGSTAVIRGAGSSAVPWFAMGHPRSTAAKACQARKGWQPAG
jgi:hypothetical protein